MSHLPMKFAKFFFFFMLQVLICKAISMPKNLDPFWEYAEPVDPQNQQKLRCNMCGKEMTGGISRLKYHLAQLTMHEVNVCKNSTLEIIHRACYQIYICS